MKQKILQWCAKRNDFYTEVLGDGDQFTNGQVVKANLVVLILLLAAVFLPGILGEML